jgi:hypothetical protein
MLATLNLWYHSLQVIKITLHVPKQYVHCCPWEHCLVSDLYELLQHRALIELQSLILWKWLCFLWGPLLSVQQGNLQDTWPTVFTKFVNKRRQWSLFHSIDNAFFDLFQQWVNLTFSITSQKSPLLCIPHRSQPNLADPKHNTFAPHVRLQQVWSSLQFLSMEYQTAQGSPARIHLRTTPYVKFTQ